MSLVCSVTGLADCNEVYWSGPGCVCDCVRVPTLRWPQPELRFLRWRRRQLRLRWQLPAAGRVTSLRQGKAMSSVGHVHQTYEIMRKLLCWFQIWWSNLHLFLPNSVLTTRKGVLNSKNIISSFSEWIECHVTNDSGKATILSLHCVGYW